MIKAPVELQDLRRKIYAKAKADASWRFWGLYVHVCKRETLRAAYEKAKENDGAPGIDGVTFEAIEERGVESFLEQIRDELTRRTYVPLRARRQEIPKDGGKVRVLSIPCIRDRVVQGALKLIVEPIFEADFQSGSYGYRPKRAAHEAINRVAQAIVQRKTRVIDIDLRSYFDGVWHDVLLAKVARRIDDDDVMHLLRLMLKASGKRGVPQGGVISPVLSNLYLNEVDRMLERAKESTRCGKYTFVEYVRFADDLVGGHRLDFIRHYADSAMAVISHPKTRRSGQRSGCATTFWSSSIFCPPALDTTTTTGARRISASRTPICSRHLPMRSTRTTRRGRDLHT